MNPANILAIYNFRMRKSLFRVLWEIATNRVPADPSAKDPGAAASGQPAVAPPDQPAPVSDARNRQSVSGKPSSGEHTTSQNA